MTVYTIGYEGCEIDEFIEYLVKKKIQLIADVRKNPISRKRGFSKNKLAARLSEKNIDYVHYKGLGVPSEWRKRAKQNLITRERMFDDYVEKILPEHSQEIEDIRDRAKKLRVALLCYERAADDCHRRRVSDRLRRAKRGKAVIKDLSVPDAKGFPRWLQKGDPAR